MHSTCALTTRRRTAHSTTAGTDALAKAVAHLSERGVPEAKESSELLLASVLGRKTLAGVQLGDVQASDSYAGAACVFD